VQEASRFGTRDSLNAPLPISVLLLVKRRATAGRLHLVCSIVPDYVIYHAGNSFNDEERVVAAGYDNGDLKVFDLKMMALRWQTNVKNGICGLEFDRRDIPMNKLVVAGLDSVFNVFDVRTFHAEHEYAKVTQKVPF
jgi:hypothetical protein